LLQPNPNLTPEDIVLCQLEALKHEEFEHCFKFASYENKRFTGPLLRFSNMIRVGYPCMLRWDEIAIDKFKYKSGGTQAEFIVTIYKGKKSSRFAWILRKQAADERENGGCWMTDGVAPL